MREFNSEQDFDKFYNTFKKGDIFTKHKKHGGGHFIVTRKEKAKIVHANSYDSSSMRITYRVWLRQLDNSFTHKRERPSLVALSKIYKRDKGAIKILFGR